MPIDTNRAAVARKAVHPVDEVLPIPKLAVYGTQHVLAFYAGAVLVPIIVAGALKLSPEQMIHLINADLFTCGIATIIQSVGFWKVGVKLPLIQGVTFAAVSPMIAIGNDPRTHLVHGKLDLTEDGTIAVEGRSSKTSVPGVFAAGDVIDPSYRQAITAAGSGTIAALDAEHYLAALEDH